MTSAEAIELPPRWRDARVAVVVPTYNEAANLPELIDGLLALNLPNLGLLVVDDNSPDGTGELAEKLAGEMAAGKEPDGREPLTVLHRATKGGLAGAYVHGMTRALQAGADFVVQMDGDLSHPPVYIPQMLGTLLSTRADLVIGSRYVPGGTLAGDWGAGRHALSRGANLYVEAILGMRIRDVTSGYKLWRRRTLLDLDLETIRSSGYSFQVEMHHRAHQRGHRIIEIPIHFEERRLGSSKMSRDVKLEAAIRPLELWLQGRQRRRRRRPGIHGPSTGHLRSSARSGPYAVPQSPGTLSRPSGQGAGRS